MSNKTVNNLDDAALVNRVLKGDNTAFGTVIKNTEGLVARIVFKIVSRIEDRKDIVQDIYLKAFKGLPGFKMRSKLSTWVGNIAYNTCINYLEKKKLVFSGDLFEGNGDDDEALNNESTFSNETETLVFDKQLSAVLTKEIEKLPPLYKTLITLYHNEEMGYAEIGQVTNLPEGTVKSYLFRARKKLKENILSQYKRDEL